MVIRQYEMINIKKINKKKNKRPPRVLKTNRKTNKVISNQQQKKHGCKQLCTTLYLRFPL